MGSEKAKGDFSETLNFLKDNRFHMSEDSYLQNFVLFQNKYLKVYFANLNEHYYSKIGLSSSALRGILLQNNTKHSDGLLVEK
jgi:hypothetical protein